MNYKTKCSPSSLSNRNNVSPDATRTVSTLNLMVTANQDESLLYCVAENSLFRNGSIIDLWQLEVHCKFGFGLFGKYDVRLKCGMLFDTGRRCIRPCNP